MPFLGEVLHSLRDNAVMRSCLSWAGVKLQRSNTPYIAGVDGSHPKRFAHGAARKKVRTVSLRHKHCARCSPKAPTSEREPSPGLSTPPRLTLHRNTSETLRHGTCAPKNSFRQWKGVRSVCELLARRMCRCATTLASSQSASLWSSRLELFLRWRRLTARRQSWGGLHIHHVTDLTAQPLQVAPMDPFLSDRTPGLLVLLPPLAAAAHPQPPSRRGA